MTPKPDEPMKPESLGFDSEALLEGRDLGERKEAFFEGAKIQWELMKDQLEDKDKRIAELEQDIRDHASGAIRQIQIRDKEVLALKEEFKHLVRFSRGLAEQIKIQQQGRTSNALSECSYLEAIAHINAFEKALSQGGKS